MGKRLADICLATWPDSDEILAASADSSFTLERIPSLQAMPDLGDEDASSSSTESEFDSTPEAFSKTEDDDDESDLTAAYDPDLALKSDEDAPESQETEDGLNDEQNEEDLHNCALAASRYTWPTGARLKVLCMDPPPGLSKKVRDIVDTWEQHANIHFDFVHNAPATIRISFKQGTSNWSKLGWQSELVTDQSKATMNLDVNERTPEYKLRRRVLHEFGHALGLIHEHSSPTAKIPWDRDAVYTRCSYDGWSKQKVKEQIFRVYDYSELTQYSAFDRHSIMLYPISRTMTKGRLEVPWNLELSAMDKKFIATLYPKSPGDSFLANSPAHGLPPAGGASMESALPIRSVAPAPKPASAGYLMGKFCDNPKCPFDEPCERDWNLLMARHGPKSSSRRMRS